MLRPTVSRRERGDMTTVAEIQQAITRPSQVGILLELDSLAPGLRLGRVGSRDRGGR